MRFQKATKRNLKARIALIGPTGSGKTFTGLELAKGLAGEGGIAVVDTEARSASKYADRFDFDVLELDTFGPETYVKAIKAAEQAGYSVLVLDSLSHAWMGTGGALEQVDNAARRSRSGNTFTAWRDVTPKHNALVDALVRCKCHLVVTMRAKTEYVVEKGRNGKTTVTKVGLSPVQRDGVEYEFDIILDVDTDHNCMVSKTRMSEIDGKVYNKPTHELGRTIAGWLDSGKPAPKPQQLSQPEETPEQRGARLKGKCEEHIDALVHLHGLARELVADFLRDEIRKQRAFTDESIDKAYIEAHHRCAQAAEVGAANIEPEPEEPTQGPSKQQAAIDAMMWQYRNVPLPREDKFTLATEGVPYSQAREQIDALPISDQGKAIFKSYELASRRQDNENAAEDAMRDGDFGPEPH